MRWSSVVRWSLVAFSVAGARGRISVADDRATPTLSDPARAVEFLLSPGVELSVAQSSAPASGAAPSQQKRAWDGSAGEGTVLFLFGSYRTLLSSQDLPLCGFSPSCSRFSQRAFDECGWAEGFLLSFDRLLRDHPLARRFYPETEDGHLLKDAPERYCLRAFE